METPPLTRGRRAAPAEVPVAVGNTPAYAGKTPPPRSCSHRVEKHPRLRGEDEARQKRRSDSKETPPLTRGRLEKVPDVRLDLGNTPAYAGKTIETAACTLAARETPPLTRGRHALSVRVKSLRGNTPAYAGKTTETATHRRSTKETPPLTRGRHALSVRVKSLRGNTPAYAGKTECDIDRILKK